MMRWLANLSIETPSRKAINGDYSLVPESTDSGICRQSPTACALIYTFTCMHNSAESLARSMTYEEMAGDVVEHLDKERLHSAVVIGHSMGGKVRRPRFPPIHIATLPAIVPLASPYLLEKRSTAWVSERERE